MTDAEEQQRVLLINLAIHAGPARGQLCLSIPDTARLAALTEDAVTAIEQGKVCMLLTIMLIDYAVFLGLNSNGLPRPRHPGMW